MASNHAQTVRVLARTAPAAPFGNGQAVVDPYTGARYSMRRAGPEYRISLESQGMRAEQALHYEFGSGRHAYGYLGKIDDGSWVDTRLNYYPPIKAWDFTSGQSVPHSYLTSQPLGRPLNEEQAMRCFECHSTVVRADGVGRGDAPRPRVRPEQSTLGVTCESCHGPRADHVREFQAGARPANGRPPRWTADRMNQACGRCHGLTDVNPSHPVLARFQPWGLEKSRCFQASGGRLSCSTCHDPHENARQDEAFYVARCQGCHSGSGNPPARTVCKVNQKSGCVGCHMPRDSKSMLHTTLTDHRIGIPTPKSGD